MVEANQALNQAQSKAVDDPSWTLHNACYFGRLDVVTRLLQAGADANEAHAASETGWVCGPTPLHKAVTAWAVTPRHVAIIELLLQHGARVDRSHLEDWAADAAGSQQDQRVLELLTANLRD